MSKLSKIIAIAGLSVMPVTSLAQTEAIPSLTDDEMQAGRLIATFMDCTVRESDAFALKNVFSKIAPSEAEITQAMNDITMTCETESGVSSLEVETYINKMNQKYTGNWALNFQ